MSAATSRKCGEPSAEHLALAALASLRTMTPARLDAILRTWPTPSIACAHLSAAPARGVLDDATAEAVFAELTNTRSNANALARVYAQRGTRVHAWFDTDFPIRDELPYRPRVLWSEGSAIGALQQPRVAIVGTRAATPGGLADAHTLGFYCAQRGISVVSGMAIGIDGAAHRGAIDGHGTSIGVLATGLDIEYPRRHHALYRAMRTHGLLVSEAPLGTRPHAGRFPVRNRIIAGIADVVVVVEATLRGGARITADYALEYGRPVLAMPGARRNPAAAGCNALIADGAQPLLDPTDLLPALGLPAADPVAWDAGVVLADLSANAQRVYAACQGEPATNDVLAMRTGMDSAAVSLAVSELEAHGAIARDRGRIAPVA
jgi:DNA processing protein